ncbi:MAG: class I SAM-dependent methyltransferase [Planctomycetes bacterium]|nr:class I SAM-dependent methyltransferase [Planctomycetota bacterium]
MADPQAETFVDRCILLLLGRDPDPVTRAGAVAAYGAGGEAAVVRHLAARDEFVVRARREAMQPRADAWPPGHFHSPLPDPALVQAEYERRVVRARRTLPGIDLREDDQRRLVAALAPFLADMPWRDDPVAGLRYYARNPYFPGGDALLLHGLLRLQPPRRVVEVGSGFSSAAMLDTDQLFLGGRTRFDFVEPHPDRLLALVGTPDPERIHIHRRPVQDVPIELFTTLEAGDILFVDSSHVAKFGSDLLHLLGEVVPRLAAGVRVHFHDVFWPFEYPKAWYGLGRAWNEVYALHHFLLCNDSFRIVCFADWLREHERPLLDRHLPLLPHYDAGSLWLVRHRGAGA